MSDIPTSTAEYRIEDPQDCAVFCKTAEAFGGFSNMAPGFPLYVGAIQIRTSEALYQALRFPEYPEVQRGIIAQKSPMAAKMVAKANAEYSRPDWMRCLPGCVDPVRIEVMRYCLGLKFAQNHVAFGELFLESQQRPIVELSSKHDRFWGMVRDGKALVGANVLGKLLMELRARAILNPSDVRIVRAPAIPNLLFLGKPITDFPLP